LAERTGVVPLPDFAGLLVLPARAALAGLALRAPAACFFAAGFFRTTAFFGTDFLAGFF
jgi:hypothetical protein